MLLKSQKNITDLIIGSDVTSGTGANKVSDLTAGQWGLAYQNGILANPAGALTSDPVRFVYRSADGSLIATPFFKKATAKYKAHDYSAPVEQVSYIGYVGSGTESITVANNTDYLVRVLLKGITAQYGDKLMYKFGAYRSTASATQREIALGIASNLTTNFKREKLQNGDQLVKFEVLSSGTSIATSGGTISVVNGDATVNMLSTGTDGGYYNADGAMIAIGDYIRLGHATATTTPVYKVINVTGGGASTAVVTLDRPFEGTTNATLAAASAGVMSAANAAAALYWGIACTGIDRSKFKAGVFNYEKVRFELQLQEFGSTIVTNSTTPSEGIGYYKEIQELEWFFKGNRFHNGLRLGTPPPTFTSDVSATTNYALFVIEYYDASYDGINATPKSPGSVIIAVPTANYAATLEDIGTDWAFTAV